MILAWLCRFNYLPYYPPLLEMVSCFLGVIMIEVFCASLFSVIICTVTQIIQNVSW